MSDSSELKDDRLRFGRYLSKISAVTRVIGIIACVGGVITILGALAMRRSDDQLGFSSIGLAVLLFGILVWSTGVFHGAVARILPTVVQMDRKLDWLGRVLAERAASTPTGATAVQAQAAAAVAPAQIVAAPRNEPSASVPEAGSPIASAARTELRAAQPSPEAEPRPEPPPEIQRTPCPHCGGLTHPEALRCVHCMKKIAR